MKTQSEKFHDLLKHFDTAVLLTHDRGAHFRARPMAIAQVDDNCDLWFITGEDSAKVHEIERNTSVQVICQGTFPTRALAVRHERAVQYFKRRG